MPIRREHRYFYPIDWPQLSAVIRFERAKGRCEVCARPHGQRVFHLGDGRWWDAEEGSWRDGAGRFICLAIGADAHSGYYVGLSPADAKTAQFGSGGGSVVVVHGLLLSRQR